MKQDECCSFVKKVGDALQEIKFNPILKPVQSKEQSDRMNKPVRGAELSERRKNLSNEERLVLLEKEMAELKKKPKKYLVKLR